MPKRKAITQPVAWSKTHESGKIRLRPGCLAAFVPTGKVGVAEVRHDTPSQFERLRGAMKGQPLQAETYTRLLINGCVWMTDAEFECQTNAVPISRMTGDVLIAGLGLGLVIHPLLQDGTTTSITILEVNEDVISLVGPTLTHPKVSIIHADVLKWEPTKGRKFDAIYFDIWPDVPNSAHLPEMRALATRYRKHLRRGGWMKSWYQDQVR